MGSLQYSTEYGSVCSHEERALTIGRTTQNIRKNGPSETPGTVVSEHLFPTAKKNFLDKSTID